MAKHDNILLTPEDLATASHGAAASLPGLSPPEASMKIRSWLQSLGLIRVETSFTEVWNDWESIWVAPIYPKLEEIQDHWTEPSVISLPAVRRIVKQDFEAPHSEQFDLAARPLEADELEAMIAPVRRELAASWTVIPETEGLVWANPAEFDDLFRRKGDKISKSEALSAFSKILESADQVDMELVPEEVTAANISPLVNALQDSFDWNPLITPEGLMWYCDPILFVDQYEDHAPVAQKIYKKRSEASLDELQMAKTFFTANKQIILDREEASRSDINRIIRHLEAQIENVLEWRKLETTENAQEARSSVTTNPTPEYQVFREWEEALNAMREEEEEQVNKGISRIKF